MFTINQLKFNVYLIQIQCYIYNCIQISKQLSYSVRKTIAAFLNERLQAKQKINAENVSI